jgi:hypothetical protein
VEVTTKTITYLGFFIHAHSEEYFMVIYVSFIPIGHTYEDIYGTYGRLSSQLKGKCILTLLHIMEKYRMVQYESKFTPYLIEYFYNFKDFLGKH